MFKTFDNYGRALKNRERHRYFSRGWRKWDRIASKLFIRFTQEAHRTGELRSIGRNGVQIVNPTKAQIRELFHV